MFIVEGASAAGPAKQARNRNFQAVLPIRGKILNVEKAHMHKALHNEEVRNIISAAGANIGQEYDGAKLRYHKIVIMTDADVDGAHIRTLLLTFFFNFMPQLIEDGHLYIAVNPLFRLRQGKQKPHYVFTEAQRDAKVIELGGGNIDVTRFKGLGEMNAEELWDCTMNPETRTLMQVNIEDSRHAEEVFERLMGEEVQAAQALHHRIRQSGQEPGYLSRGYNPCMAESIIDKPRIEAAVREILLAIGEDLERDGVRQTPERVGRMFDEIFAGQNGGAGKFLETTFDVDHRELILFRDIQFFSMCEHHLMPFYGAAHIAYIPNGRVTGLSKVVRSFKSLAARPQVQERLTTQMADLLMEKLDPLGAAVIVEARHMCMEMRGVRSPGSIITTSALRGAFEARESTRMELFTLIKGERQLV